LQIPENNEEFRVIMTSATQGARVTDTEVMLIIQANDAPIRFQQVKKITNQIPAGKKKITNQIPAGKKITNQIAASKKKKLQIRFQP
jgi:hypothetical protein